MRKLTLYLLITVASLYSCSPNPRSAPDKSADYILGGIGAFGEMVHAGVKKLALSTPLTPAEMDKIYADAVLVASRNNVDLFREPDLLVTDLFPAEETDGKDVLLIYSGTTKDEYLKLKDDAKKLQETGQYKGKAREEIARRFGRMLGYPNQRINQLLSANTDFRTLSDFGIQATNLFLYYKDLRRAANFYAHTLGMEQVADYQMACIFRMTTDSYLILVDASKGMHSADEPKTVALALITDQLEEWYSRLKTGDARFKYDFKSIPDKPHDGFVIEDTEGYLLEFERFNPHQENESFLPQLSQLTQLSSADAKGLGFKATITWLYYKDLVNMENFYQRTLGFTKVVDQGWAKIYRASNSGYVGLVDERRGMHSFTEKKAVNVSYILKDTDGWFDYAKSHQLFKLREDHVSEGPEKKYRAFVGYDPEQYYLEFDTFYDHPDNARLMKILGGDSIK